MKHSFYGGKYTVAFDEHTGELTALRHGDPWLNLAGNGLVLAMLQRVDAQQKLLDRALWALKDADLFIKGFADDDSQEGVEKMLGDFASIEADAARNARENSDPTA